MRPATKLSRSWLTTIIFWLEHYRISKKPGQSQNMNSARRPYNWISEKAILASGGRHIRQKLRLQLSLARLTVKEGEPVTYGLLPLVIALSQLPSRTRKLNKPASQMMKATAIMVTLAPEMQPTSRECSRESEQLRRSSTQTGQKAGRSHSLPEPVRHIDSDIAPHKLELKHWE